MGRILTPVGLNGWVKIRTYTETPNSLAAYKSWWLGHDEDPGVCQDFREVNPTGFAVQGKAVIAKLPDCDDRDAALALKGLVVAVPRASLPPNVEGEYYLADLVGLDVTRADGIKLGKVAEVLQTGANDVLRVVDGKIEHLIPFIASAVVDVDLPKRKVCVDWNG